MYAYAHISDTNHGYHYGSLTADISTSMKKAWSDLTSGSVTAERAITVLPSLEGRVSIEMMNAQETALQKIWAGPENDVWDDLYKKLNAAV